MHQWCSILSMMVMVVPSMTVSNHNMKHCQPWHLQGSLTHKGSSNCSAMKSVHSDNIDVIRYLVIVTRPNMGIRLLVSCR